MSSALVAACDTGTQRPESEVARERPAQTAEVDMMPTQTTDTTDTTTDARWDKLREAMVREQLVGRDITNPRVIEAMREVPRHRFVPADVRDYAYRDRPLPIGHDQTISQPYIVAKMTQELDPRATDRVLEIGTGSGYQAAVLAKLVDQLYTIEIVCPLADDARSDLQAAGYFDNVEAKCGDGYAGWPEAAPFDKIIVTAAPPTLPEALVEQLAPGGRMIVPVGESYQELKRIEKDAAGNTTQTTLLPVRFVPMVPGPTDD
jgi:protein-L-isoaspartate(D-aspartate) O-methyltransferase